MITDNVRIELRSDGFRILFTKYRGVVKGEVVTSLRTVDLSKVDPRNESETVDFRV